MYSFAPFEEYLLADDTDRYPMTCHIRFWFKGEIQRIVFEKILIMTLARHPLLSSVTQYKGLPGFRKWYFCPVNPVLNEIVKWHTHDCEFVFQPQKNPDLRTKFFVKTESGYTHLIIQFHHCVSDGIGIFQFMEDLLLLYDQEINGKQHILSPLDVELLHLRKTGGLTPSDWHEKLKFDFRRFKLFWSTFPSALSWKSASPLMPHAELNAALRKVLPNCVLTALQNRAHEANVTLNDILIFCLYKTIDHIQQQYQGKSNKMMRIGIPISLRNDKENRSPAANFVSMVFLDRHPIELSDPNALLQNIATETSQVKNSHRAYMLLQVLRIVCKIPNLLQALLKLPVCMATAVLTNLGKPFQNSALLSSDGLLRSGNLILEGLDTFPPLRKDTAAAISINGYGGQLSVTLRYDSRRYLEKEALSFLSHFVDNLMQHHFLPLHPNYKD